MRVTGSLYPFGYGLSYTTFDYSALKIENPVIGTQGSVKLSCRVKNTGKIAGDEVVQLYKDNHFIVEPGTFAVMVGSSSQDIRLQGKFEVK